MTVPRRLEGTEHLPGHEKRVPGMRDEIVVEILGDREDALEVRRIVGLEGVDPLDQLRHEAHARLVHELLFVGEVVEERALVQPDVVGEELHTHARGAIARDQLDSGIEDALA